MAVCSSVSALSDRSVVDTRVGALDARLASINECIPALESPTATSNVEVVGMVAQVHSF